MTYDSAPQPLPPSPLAPSAPHRPTGVVLAAVSLGFASLGSLVLAGLFAMAIVLVGKSPQAVAAAQAAQARSATPGAIPPSMAAIQLIYVVMAIIALGVAIWGAATVVGLLRLKPWARISIMVQGGLLAAVAGFSALSMLIAPFMAAQMQLPTNVNMSQMRIIFAGVALVFGVIALIGIWWIVYFALRGPREAFAPASRQSQNSPRRPSAPYPPPIRPAGPITDFSVAQPLPADDHQPPPNP